MLRSGRSRFAVLMAAAGWGMVGCSTQAPVRAGGAVAGMSGAVHGGQQGVAGATVQMYAVGGGGDGSAATPLLTQRVVTDANGYFVITGMYTCPSASSQVYMTGTGGDPGVGVANAQIALMAALGSCGSLSASTFVEINEVTTVAAVYALAPFMTTYAAVGSGATDAGTLASMFPYAGYFADTSDGSTPGTGVPQGATVPVAQVNTLADLVGACINSKGGVSGDGSVCGQMFALTEDPGVAPATDTIAALLQLANNPTRNTAALYALIPPASPFEPMEPSVPADFTLRLQMASGFGVGPARVSFGPAIAGFSQAAQTITVTNGTPAAVNLTSATISGVDAGDFGLVAQPGTACGAIVAANSSCTYGISFVPAAVGERMAYFILGNSTANPSIAIALDGSGVAGTSGPVTLTPASYVFTGEGVPEVFTLTNQGSSAVTIAGIKTSTTNFSVTTTCGASLAGSASCSIFVTVPLSVVLETQGTLLVYDDAAGGPQTASVTYVGLGTFTYAPYVDFGHWAIGATGVEALLIVPPNSNLSTLNFSVTGAGAGAFSFSSTASVATTSCIFSLRFAGDCMVSVYYTPTALTTSMATVTMVDPGGVSAGSFTIAGEGDPAGPDFGYYQLPPQGLYNTGYLAPIRAFYVGSTPVGTPLTSYFLVQNTGTVPALGLQAAVVTGANASEFVVTPPCATCVFTSVTFTPEGLGTRSATLSLTDGSGSGTVTRMLSLTGTGVGP